MVIHTSATMIGLLAVILIPTWVFAACQGFGAQTLGGEGKPAVHVTNLNDSGTGSLRAALSGGNRVVVFDVGGTINLASELTIRSAFLTVDGLSAPSPGITLQGKGLYIRGTSGHDIIVRGIRIRNSATDGMWITDAAYNVVIEQVSIHNSFDGNLDITRPNTRDISVCHSILAEPAGEEKNALLAYRATRMTFHHNLFIAAAQRNPQVNYQDDGLLDSNTTLDMRHNLIWDWRGTYGTRIRAGARVNVVNNYYDAAGGDRADALLICKASGAPAECNNPTTNNARAFVQGNVNVGGPDVNGRGTEGVPFASPQMTTQTALEAACTVVQQAGVRPLDAIDQSYLARVQLSGCGAPPPPPPPANDGVWLVNAGGSTYTDSAGQVWSADQAYTAGSFGYVGGKTYRTTDPIANTMEDSLYQSERYGNFSYRFDIPNGTYEVTLHFAEIYQTSLGRRLFDVFIEGVQVLDDLDLYATAGHDVAMSLTFPHISVTDGQLTLNFVTVKDHAKISALEVYAEP